MGSDITNKTNRTMKAEKFFKEYFGKEIQKKKFLIEPEDLILAMTEYAKEQHFQELAEMIPWLESELIDVGKRLIDRSVKSFLTKGDGFNKDVNLNEGKPYTIICGRCFTHNKPDAKKCEKCGIKFKEEL